jgi:hypothetical protein
VTHLSSSEQSSSGIRERQGQEQETKGRGDAHVVGELFSTPTHAAPGANRRVLPHCNAIQSKYWCQKVVTKVNQSCYWVQSNAMPVVYNGGQYGQAKTKRTPLVVLRGVVVCVWRTVFKC